jgi:hypothetical protein
LIVRTFTLLFCDDDLLRHFDRIGERPTGASDDYDARRGHGLEFVREIPTRSATYGQRKLFQDFWILPSASAPK